MLDMKFIRENPEAVKKGAELKGMKVDVDKLLALDAQKRAAQQKLQELQTEQNKASKELGPLMGQLKKETDAGKKAALEQQVAALKERPAAIKGEMVRLEEEMTAWTRWGWSLPVLADAAAVAVLIFGLARWARERRLAAPGPGLPKS